MANVVSKGANFPVELVNEMINITRGKKGGTRVLKSDFEDYLTSCKEVN